MLALTPLSGPRTLYGLGAAETHLVLGVPFKFDEKVVVGLHIYRAVDPLTVDVPKTRMPAALGAAVDQVIAKRAQQALQSKPELASNPAALLDEAKRLARLTGGSGASAGFLDPLTQAHLGRINKIDGKFSYEYLILAKDLGSSIRVRLHEVPTGSSIPGWSSLKSILVTASKVGSGTVNWVKGGIEGAFDLVKQAFKLLCKVADNDIVKLAQSYVGAQAEVSNLAVAFKAGDKAALTKIVTDVYASGSTAKIAAINSALTKLQGLCAGPASGGGAAPPKKKVRWPLIAVGVVGGAAVLGGAGWLAFGGKRRRR